MVNVYNTLTSPRVSQLRLYILAILVYLGIASLVVVPAAQRAHTSQQVKAQLSQYVRQTGSQKAPAAAAAPQISGTPAAISIDRLGINLPVAPGYYNIGTQKWTLDSKHVFTDNYTTANPVIATKQTQVTVMYGHDIPGVLVKTAQLTYGDILTVNTQNGYVFRYYYDQSKVVTPNDTSILHETNTGDPLMLVTCTGARYQFRHAMYFHLLSVHKVTLAPSSSKTANL
jgi:LPXTG-site transpeptidase (sortase) family protein